MRIIGILYDQTAKIKVGYVLFSRTREFGNLFKVFDVPQVKFLLQSHGDIDNAKLENGEIVITEHSEDRLPKYYAHNKAAINTNYSAYVIIVNKNIDKQITYDCILMTNSMSNIQLQTLPEMVVKKYHTMTGIQLVNAKFVDKNGDVIISGIKGELPTTDKTQNKPQATAKPQVKPQPKTQAIPQQQTQIQQPQQVAPPEPKKEEEPRDKNGRTASEKREWRYELARCKSARYFGKQLATLLALGYRNPVEQLYYEKKSTCIPKSDVETYYKALAEQAMKHAKNDSEKAEIKEWYKVMKREYVMNVVINKDRYAALNPKFYSILNYLIYDDVFKKGFSYEFDSITNKLENNYGKNNVFRGVKDSSPAKIILTQSGLNEDASRMVEYHSIQNVAVMSRKTIAKELYTLEPFNERVSYVYVGNTIFNARCYKIKNIGTEWADVGLFLGACSKQEDYALIPLVKMAYLYTKRLAAKEFNNLHGDDIEGIIGYMSVRLAIYLVMISNHSSTLFDKFVQKYGAELKEIGLDLSEISGVKYQTKAYTVTIEDRSAIENIDKYFNNDLTLFSFNNKDYDTEFKDFVRPVITVDVLKKIMGNWFDNYKRYMHDMLSQTDEVTLGTILSRIDASTTIRIFK